MAREYCKYVVLNGVYRADARDLGLKNTKQPHDVIVISINYRKKTCQVKTITSLEEEYKGKMVFQNRKLDKVRNGEIIVIPQNDFNTHKLCGVNNKLITIKISKLYLSTTGTTFPRRFKQLIINKKR